MAIGSQGMVAGVIADSDEVAAVSLLELIVAVWCRSLEMTVATNII
jgi:hypothetical protein